MLHRLIEHGALRIFAIDQYPNIPFCRHENSR